ncbi:phosphatase PAP2 family protein [Nakamurella deserti]|uniref:phosphatase PAP2 family protein n=1 Tax=Nakamurella deserti TaxID=2164074 RepID=UPI000DBE3534|nr:phosphatase PAP2 family protein [Nakamurella deserti]
MGAVAGAVRRTPEERPARAAVLRAAAATVVAGLVLAAVWVALGLLISRTGDSWPARLDRSASVWMVDHRTPLLDGLTRVGSLLGQTLTKVVVTAVAALVIGIRLRSWLAVTFVVASTAIEGAVFLAVTTIVARPRPDVPRLEAVTVDSSFPSGHTGAAAAYAAIAVVVLAHTRRTWLRVLTVVLAVAVPAAVAASRMYRGAHYLTDVLAGLALGAACVLVVFVIIRRFLGSPTGGHGPRPPVR